MHLAGRLAEQAGIDWCFGGDSQILCPHSQEGGSESQWLGDHFSKRHIEKKNIIDMSWRSEHRRK